MFLLFKNLLSILYHAPALIGVLKSVIDVIGSESVIKIIEAIRDALTGETITVPPGSAPAAVKRKFRERLKERIGLAFTGMTADELQAYHRIRNRESELPNA